MRQEHTFQFSSEVIGEAAQKEAEYHESRLEFWQAEYDMAVDMVEQTAGVKIEKHPVTGGYEVDVVIDYGDPGAYHHMQRSFRKVNAHRDAAERYRTDERVYRTQGGRYYELDSDDVHHFRLGGEPRED